MSKFINQIKSFICICSKAVGKAIRALFSPDSRLAHIIGCVISTVFLVLSAFCLIYYLICGIGAGFGISALWIWLLASLIFIFLALYCRNLPPFSHLRIHIAVRAIVALVLIASLTAFALIEGLVIGGMTADAQDGLDYVVILGAKVNGRTPSLALRERIDRAYEYLSKNPDTIAIASGGQGRGEDISEAECMYLELVGRGIPSDRILLEQSSTSTYENLSFSFDLIPASSTVGLISSNFHIYRAVSIASALGRTVHGIPARYSNPLLIHYMVREFFSVTLYKLTGRM